MPDSTIRELVADTIAVPADELPAVLTDSDTGEVLGNQRASSAASVEKALATAAEVHETGAWSELPREERAAALRQLGKEIASRVEDLAALDSRDTGVPLSTTGMFLGAVSALFEPAALQVEAGFEHEEKQSAVVGGCDQWRLPWGPAAVFLPWNAPAHMAIVRTADALVAGSPIILKPSEWTPHSSGPLAEAFQAALPTGVVQILHGGVEVGQKIVGDDRIAAVSYTGGVNGGKAVAAACAAALKPVDLELSGNNPVVVLPGEDPMAVASQAVIAMTMLNGQYCVAARRLIVPEAEVDAYADAFGAVLGSLPIGPATDPGTALGPISHEPHRVRLEQQLEEFAAVGCEVRRFGTLPEGAGGHFFQPAIVLGDQAGQLKEEVFGPVLQIRGYRDRDEAIRIAHDHEYGRCAYVFGSDRDEARAVGRKLRAGIVRLNSPFGAPDVMPLANVWGISGLGVIGEGPKFFSGLRFVS
jgi:phenylacetaldehyde dehydrogenase